MDRFSLEYFSGNRVCFWFGFFSNRDHLSFGYLFMKLFKFHDIPLILYLTGNFIFFFSFITLIPILIAFITCEWAELITFSFTFFLFITLSLLLTSFSPNQREIKWLHGMAATALVWLVVMVVSAIPLYFSSHYGSFLDSCFETMSGITTTGLSLTKDLDHLPISLNIWRHLLQFICGQGIVVLSLVFLTPAGVGFQAMVGEGKDERLLPSIQGTSKSIWKISMIYFGIGFVLLSIIGLVQGLTAPWSIFHSFNIYCSAWSTGGFLPQSQSMLYYHNIWYEVIAVSFFILGSINFGLHFVVWYKDRKELIKDIEIKTMIATISVLTVFLTVGLIKDSIYSTLLPLTRKGLFQLLSAHFGAGQCNIYSQQFLTQWGEFGLVVIILAMMFGGSASSTAGGFKLFRIGVFFKSVFADIKRLLQPKNSVIVDKIHHIQDIVLTDKIVKNSIIIIMLYILTHLIGALAGMLAGNSAIASLFEATSATANVGLSTGITNPAMPSYLKIVYIITMWMGRLEFFATFVLIASFYRDIKSQFTHEVII
ncbi:TrkH family potassium uptake protein [bacterium]|nr:TrkH family potassium uptake protein [bacterium]